MFSGNTKFSSNLQVTMRLEGSSCSTEVLVYLIILQLPLMAICRAEVWSQQCPSECTCHESHFSELPLYQFLHEGASKDNTPLHNNNNAMYEDDIHPSHKENVILKMAMCVFQQGTEPFTLLSKLSTEIQVLTILQARDSGEVALEAECLSHFQQLEVLEIHGFYHEENNHSHNEVLQKSTELKQSKLILWNDALRPLASLKYLNLQNIKLLGHPAQGNRAPPVVVPLEPISNDISVSINTIPRPKHKRQRGSSIRRLIFLPPSDGEGDILPYKVYVEQQEKAGLSTFTGLTNLVFVRVFGCGLHEINWEMFDGLYNLHYLSLERNQLLFIPDFAFLGAPNLKTLSLAGNQLLSLQSTSLAGLFELEKLDLSHNNFSHLSELSLPPFPKLQIADFRYNPIESVFASTFEIMNATSKLYIGGTESALNIQPNSFLGLIHLKELNILNVNIPLLERELLTGMPKLKQLEMTGVIEGLSFDAFLEVPKLEKLILHSCNINSISMDAFYGLYGLIYLDLSDNFIESLPPGLFDQQFSLRELHLNNNKLKKLPPGFLANIPAKMIRLDDNPWHCTCAMKDWQPAVINKVKQKGQLNFCQFQYDKGSMCNSTVIADRYVYDKRVAPRCTSPPKFKNFSVFQVLRKELKCNKKQYIKMDRKAYLRKKYEDYEKSIKPSYTGKKPIFKYYHHAVLQSSGGTKTGLGNSTRNSDAKQYSNKKLFQDIPPSRIPELKETTAVLPTHNITKSTGDNQMLEDSKKKTEIAGSEATITTNNTTSVPNISNPSSALPPYSTDNTTEREPNISKFHFTDSSSITSNVFTQKPYVTHNPDLLVTKEDAIIKTEDTISTETAPYDKALSAQNKKEMKKLELTKAMKQKTSAKEKIKSSEPNYMIYEENGRQIKLSKKEWKLEMERKRQEKLKMYQT